MILYTKQRFIEKGWLVTQTMLNNRCHPPRKIKKLKKTRRIMSKYTFAWEFTRNILPSIKNKIPNIIKKSNDISFFRGSKELRWLLSSHLNKYYQNKGLLS